MISDFFVISPRGDTIIAKQYRVSSDTAAHERSHTEAFFRKVQFWDSENEDGSSKSKGDAPPVFLMPDGLSYCHVKRNGMIFACRTPRNVSPTAIVEVSNWKQEKWFSNCFCDVTVTVD